MMDGMMLNGGRGGLPPAQFLTNLVSVFSSLPVFREEEMGNMLLLRILIWIWTTMT